MAVHTAERKPSVFNTFHHALKMRRDIRDLCLRDFGYKFKPRIGETESQSIRRREFERRELDKEIDCIIDILRSISTHIRLANSIHPTIWAEYSERRLHQTLAIAECGKLSAEIQFAVEDFSVSVNQFIPIDELIQTQIKLLRSWRQSDNRMIEKLKDKDKI